MGENGWWGKRERGKKCVFVSSRTSDHCQTLGYWNKKKDIEENYIKFTEAALEITISTSDWKNEEELRGVWQSLRESRQMCHHKVCGGEGWMQWGLLIKLTFSVNGQYRLAKEQQTLGPRRTHSLSCPHLTNGPLVLQPRLLLATSGSKLWETDQVVPEPLNHSLILK